MTWTKLGTDILDPLTDLSRGAALAHVEALVYSNRAGHDLRIPEDRLRFLPHPPTPDEVRELIDADWWRRDGTVIDISLRFGDWQLSADEVEKRRKNAALRQERKRRHDEDDHSICLPKSCARARERDSTGDVTRDEPSEQRVTPAGHGSARQGTAGKTRQGEEMFDVPEPRTEEAWPDVKRAPLDLDAEQTRESWHRSAVGYDK